MYLKLVILVFVHIIACCSGSEIAESEKSYEYDPNGYVIFCLCMGRFGNQADHFLGAMAFAENLNRTFVIPPFRTYKNVPFGEWFKVDKLSEYHRSITAEDFMKYIAPTYWPIGKRIGFCWLSPNSPNECKMKDGNPFGPFWDELGVDFDSYERYDFDFLNYDLWQNKFPPNKFPVLAFKGAPAQFPCLPQHRFYQNYFEWSDKITSEIETYINSTFQGDKFIGIHLRNGADWLNACEYVKKQSLSTFMASPQCLENTNQHVTIDICYPNTGIILNKLHDLIFKTGINKIYVATDQNTLKNEIENSLKEFNVIVYHYDPWLPVIDLAILARSDYFIGNCVSSFTSFVKRERDLKNMQSEFWGL